jgi:hypothetical protein
MDCDKSCLFQAAADVSLAGLVHVEHSSPTSGSELYVTGALKLHQELIPTAGASISNTGNILLTHNESDAYELVRIIAKKRQDMNLCGLIIFSMNGQDLSQGLV